VFRIDHLAWRFAGAANDKAVGEAYMYRNVIGKRAKMFKT